MLTKLNTQLTLLTQPRHLDSISRRLKLLISDLDRLSASQHAPGGGRRQAQVTHAPAAGAPSPLQEQILPLLARLAPHLPHLPHLLTRMRTLSGLHAAAADVQGALGTLEAEQLRSRGRLDVLTAAVEGVEKSLEENAQVVRGNPRHVLVIHGGAGTMSREGSTPEQRELYRKVLRQALVKGHEVLSAGGEALDAAVAAVGVMEDCPLFNSGKGAVFNIEGKNELEASLMLSKPPASHPSIPPNRRGMSLTLLGTARNPCARRARVPHPFIGGPSANVLAQKLGEEPVDPSYFFTEARWREHRRELGLPEEPLPHPRDGGEAAVSLDQIPKGTVGAVALDARGCIAAVTSTGGRTNKLAGRIGDTPHMGSGFWAEEWKVDGLVKRAWRKITRRGVKRAMGYFIRYNAAANIADRMKFLGESIGKATRSVVNALGENEGIGGVIALDEQGNYSLPMNCSGMYRGVITAEGVSKVAIFADEELK
ncbi:nucleophile aminohydrolase [Phellopilus nigrolimitatus]|nr:nucleophile aminohydrolase [Phellopilus nigrolimitatus]